MKSTIVFALAGAAAAQGIGKGSRAVSEPLYSCPPNFTLQGKTCERTVTTAPRTQCLQGVLQGDQCLTSVPKQQRCPFGTEQVGKNCVTKTQLPPNRFCPTGFTDNGFQCELQEALALLELCEIGSREGAQCVSVETAPYNQRQFCPPGYEEHAKGGCWKTDVYDCTPPYQGKGHQFRGLVGKEGGSRAPVTPARVNIIQQTCERKESAAYNVEKSCPPGFTDTGLGCIQKTFHPPVQRCSTGAPLEACFKLRTAVHQQNCPPGTRMEKNMCIQTQNQPMESFCATGQDNGNACITLTQPQIFCDTGVLTGGVCISKETAQPQVTVTVTCTGKNCYGAHH